MDCLDQGLFGDHIRSVRHLSLAASVLLAQVGHPGAKCCPAAWPWVSYLVAPDALEHQESFLDLWEEACCGWAGGSLLGDHDRVT